MAPRDPAMAPPEATRADRAPATCAADRATAAATPPPIQPPDRRRRPAARGVEDEQPKGRGLIERMTDATRKLRAQRAPVPTGEPGAGEPVLTYRLPLKAGARTVGLTAYQLGLTVDEREVLTDVSFTARPGTLTAVTGPSAARNSALLGLLAGTRDLGSG